MLQVLSASVSLIEVARAGIEAWTGIQAARAAIQTARTAALPPLWPVLAAAVAAGALVAGTTAVIMRSTTIRADLSTDDGRADAVARVKEALRCRLQTYARR